MDNFNGSSNELIYRHNKLGNWWSLLARSIVIPYWNVWAVGWLGFTGLLAVSRSVIGVNCFFGSGDSRFMGLYLCLRTFSVLALVFMLFDLLSNLFDWRCVADGKSISLQSNLQSDSAVSALCVLMLWRYRYCGWTFSRRAGKDYKPHMK